MDPTDNRARSPRRELQGPRPAPLRVRKDSYKVKKPPLAPTAPPQYRPPVIIYTVSPKVIHANPSEFMSLVQRLTGTSSSASAAEPFSPAARFATIESARQITYDQLGLGFDHRVIGSGPNGILSPVPNSLLPISPGFFSPPATETGNSLSFFQQLSSPVVHGSRGGGGYVDNTFLVSPSNLLQTPMVPSPGAYWDLFNLDQEDF